MSDCNEEDALSNQPVIGSSPRWFRRGIELVITKRGGAAEWPHGLNWALMGPKPDPFHTTKQKPHMEGISSISPERGPGAQRPRGLL